MNLKIKLSEFWEEIGTVFNNPENIIAEEYNKYDDTVSKFTLLKKGTYLIVDKDSHGYRLYNIDKGKNVFFEAGWLDDDIEFDVIHTPPLEVLELALESITKTILTLTSDGWEANPDNQYFDLTPELKKLKIIQEAVQTLKGIENEQNPRNP
jgi:hypothetical protein